MNNSNILESVNTLDYYNIILYYIGKSDKEQAKMIAAIRTTTNEIEIVEIPGHPGRKELFSRLEAVYGEGNYTIIATNNQPPSEGYVKHLITFDPTQD
jgi:hypothetical protein